MCSVIQWCLPFCNPMDCSLPGSFVHGIFQARIQKWVAISYFRKSSKPRNIKFESLASPALRIFFFFFLPPCCLGSTNALISHASKVMLKILQAGFSNTWTVNFLMFKLVLEKAEGPEIKLPTSTGSWKSKAVPEKHLFLLYWLCQSLWLCGSQETVGNSERDGNTRPPDLSPENAGESVCRSGSNS